MDSSSINPSGAPASAAERIELVLDTAERAAAEIRADAEAQARLQLDEARRQAEAMTRERVTMISELTEALIEHATLVATQCDSLIRALESTMQRLGADSQAPRHAPPIEPPTPTAARQPEPAPEGVPAPQPAPEAPLERDPRTGRPSVPAATPAATWPPPQPAPAPPAARPEPPSPAAQAEPPPAAWPPPEPRRGYDDQGFDERERPPAPQPPHSPDPAPAPGPPPMPEPPPVEPPAPTPLADVPAEPPAWNPPSPAYEDPVVAIPAEAYLRATRLALDGRGREEIADELRGEFGINDPGPILDRVLGGLGH